MPFTIDNFALGPYSKTLPPSATDTNLQLPPGRQTIFSNSADDPTHTANRWVQPSTLDIFVNPEKQGIFIVNSGFGAQTSGQVRYGTEVNSPAGGPTVAPLR